MSDSVDDANATQAHFNELQISKVRQAAKQMDAAATGYCLSCGQQITKSGQRWCNADCRDDWEKLKKRGLL
ncbi:MULTISPECIES: hypothetical protein [Idiomarina]|uniref:hypothetical protein n=1 Tax=Idiomarina TaxID=135575 RepID=UPI00129BD986|nr:MULTISPECIES: hypothetical protein [Idiomarina]MRJ40786.1 hypothetical protein [Idiomarina sp. FeN1]NCU56590.1 hypothetical protein [Idiomarina sp. FenA--70]NCU58970.1 hypothetical protein [Idiomarina sp. FenBw--71]UUN14533.1 hypothetical protein KGF88_04780 [Idiomarina loihiensis]